MNRIRSALRETAFIAVVQVLVRVRSFVLLPLVFGVLGPEAFGQWTVALGVVEFLAVLANGNIHVSLLRHYASADSERRGRLVWTALTFSIATAAFVAALLAAFAAILPQLREAGPGAVPLLQVGALLVLTHVARDLGANCLRASGHVRLFAVLHAVPQFAQIGAALAATLLGWSLGAAFMLLVVSDIAIAVPCLMAIARRDRPVAPSFAVLRETLRFSLPTIPVSLADWLLNQGDRIVIAVFLGTAATGVYSAAYTVSTLAVFAVRPLQVVLLARLSPLWDAGKRERVKGALALALKVYLALAMPIAVGSALVGPPALSWLTGGSRSEWSVALLMFLGVGNAIYGAWIIAVHALWLLERTRQSAAIFLLGASINVLGNILLVPRVGLMGAGAMTLVAYTVCLALTLAAPRDLLPVRLRLADLGRITTGLVPMTLFVQFVGTTSGVRIGVCVVGGAALYLATLGAMHPLSHEDRQLLFSKWREKRNRRE